MSEPRDYYGTAAAALVTGIHNQKLERRLGPRDATLRFGPGESALFRVERVRAYKLYGDRLPPDRAPTVLYSITESAFAVGVTRKAFLKLAPPAPAVLVSDQSDKRYPLWPEPLLHALRKAIASGIIKVSRRSLTRPLLGVVIAPPRHTLAESLPTESAALEKSRSWTRLAI